MRKSRFTESQVVAILKEADAGMKVSDARRKHGISDATDYKWNSKYGRMEASDLKRNRELEAENAKLKRMYAELTSTSVTRIQTRQLTHRRNHLSIPLLQS